jgi:Arc/MetJ-type ribon-helix-helix transcriptional regulator
MTINLPDDLERFLRSEVHLGHFPSEQDAIAEALRLLQSQLRRNVGAIPAARIPARVSLTDPLVGTMRDAADEMDDIVAEAMKQREQQPWRLSSSE